MTRTRIVAHKNIQYRYRRLQRVNAGVSLIANKHLAFAMLKERVSCPFLARSSKQYASRASLFRKCIGDSRKPVGRPLLARSKRRARREADKRSFAHNMLTDVRDTPLISAQLQPETIIYRGTSPRAGGFRSVRRGGAVDLARNPPPIRKYSDISLPRPDSFPYPDAQT